MVDYNFDNLMKRCILEVIENKDTIQNTTVLWESLTRQMFKNYSVLDVYNKVEKALEEASDEQWIEHKYPKGFFTEDWKYNPKKKSIIKINLNKSKIKKLIDDNLKITDVAKNYGIKFKGKNAYCPFHEDKNPSLSLDNKKNVFYCFGCKSKGNIIEFIRKLENLRGGKKNGVDMERQQKC